MSLVVTDFRSPANGVSPIGYYELVTARASNETWTTFPASGSR